MFEDLLNHEYREKMVTMYVQVQLINNTYHCGYIGNAKEFLSHLGKIFDSYQLVIASVFQKAYKAFMIIVPILLKPNINYKNMYFQKFLLWICFLIKDDT